MPPGMIHPADISSPRSSSSFSMSAASSTSSTRSRRTLFCCASLPRSEDRVVLQEWDSREETGMQFGWVGCGVWRGDRVGPINHAKRHGKARLQLLRVKVVLGHALYARRLGPAHPGMPPRIRSAQRGKSTGGSSQLAGGGGV